MKLRDFLESMDSDKREDQQEVQRKADQLIALLFMDTDKREHQREIQRKIDHLLISMAMRLVLYSYSLPEQLLFITHKLKEVYTNIQILDDSYKEAIKKAEYTDWILQNRIDVDEQKDEFMKLARELYDEVSKLKEAPICIRENYLMLKSEFTNLIYLGEECKL